MKNAAYFLAMVINQGEELIVTSGIKRPIIKARCYDSDGKLSDINLVFSEICEARKSTSLGTGDIIYFQAKVGECPKDNLVFYPGELHIIRKNSQKDVDMTTISEKLLNSKMSPFEKETNMVIFKGKVVKTEGLSVQINIPKPEFLRGEVLSSSNIWVVSNGFIPKGDADVMFAGEISDGKLKGDLYEVR